LHRLTASIEGTITVYERRKEWNTLIVEIEENGNKQLQKGRYAQIHKNRREKKKQWSKKENKKGTEEKNA
jgi:hypothetical protein